MVIATIAFLTILFGRGVVEAPFIGSLDKGVKKHMVDQEDTAICVSARAGDMRLINSFRCPIR